MNIIVGLGNHGDTYRSTRHNVGFLILDNLADILECPKFSTNKKTKSDVCKYASSIFVKPKGFMNESGISVRAAVDYYQKGKDYSPTNLKNLYVIHDDLDLPLGSYKIQFGIGPKTHNGINSIYQHLGTRNFWHVRVGIDTREGGRLIPPQTYVLQKMPPNEIEKFSQTKIEIVKKLINIISE